METALRSKILGGLSMFLTLTTWGQTNAWINEIHYDDASSDANETIEVVIENPGTLSDYEIYLYRDSGTFYESVALDDTSVAKGTTEGTFSFFTWQPSSIQNGAADGIALVYQGTLISSQFLSYEGTLTATEGPAKGLTSTDILVSEGGGALSTESLQLSGSGLQYSDFSWKEPATATFGSVNMGQTMVAAGNPAPSILNIAQNPTTENVTPNEAVSISAEITDANGIASASLVWGFTSGNLTNTIPMSSEGGGAYKTNTKIPAQPDGTYVYYEVTATDKNTTPASTNSPEQFYISKTPLRVPSLIITEIGDPSDNKGAGFVEIYNNGTTIINFNETNVHLAKYTNGNTTASNILLTGTIFPGDFYIISEQDIEFSAAYGFDADLVNEVANGNGDDAFALVKGANVVSGTLFDIYGEIGIDGTGEAWEYLDGRAIRNNLSTKPNSNWMPNEWIITSATTAGMTPGQEGSATIYTFNGTSWLPANPNDYAAASDNVIVQSDTATFTQNIAIHNITIKKGAVLKIEQVLELHGAIINNGSLVFVNDSSRLGQLATVPITSSVSGSGTVTVQRYIPARNTFRLLSPSVTTTTSIHANWQEGAISNTDNPHPGFGTHITGATTDQTNGFDGTIMGAPSMFTFNNSEQTWNKIVNTDGTELTAGKAYRLLVLGDRSIDLNESPIQPTNTILCTTGKLIIGAYAYVNLSQTPSGFSLIGNPYQAIVDMNKVLKNSTNLNPHQYYVWDPNLNERGGYVTVSLPAGTNFLNSDVNEFLQPGQAIFVRTLHAGAASILFEETDKAPFKNPTDVFREGQNTNSTAYIEVQMYTAQAFLNHDPVADGLRVNFSAEESNDVLPNDAAKLGNIDENVALLNEAGDYLSIENRAMPLDGEVLHLFNNQYRHSDYTYKITVNNFTEDMKVYLKDDYLQTSTELTNNAITLVDFSVKESLEGSVASNRFSLLFDLTKLSVKENTFSEITIYPNPSENAHFFITVPKMLHGKINVSLYNILGQEVVHHEKEMDVNQRIEMSVPALKPGIYLVKVIHGNNTFMGKALIQK